MKLTDIVASGAVVPSLNAESRDDAIGELIDALISAGAAAEGSRQDLITRLLEREEKGSTGFGRGVAVPHVKHASVSKLAAAIGLTEKGIDFASLDKQPVYSIFLLLSPEDTPEEHLQAMEVIFKSLGKDTFRRFLRQAESAEDVMSLLEEADAQQLPG